MKYREEKCPVCCGDDFFAVRKNNNVTGCYCKNCGQWIKWLTKKDVLNFKSAGEFENGVI